MVVEKTIAVEAYELADQAPIRIVGRRFDFETHGAEELGKIMNPHGQLADHAEGASASALERPEQIRIGA
jgi:hypothetical protein